ncbi:MAG: class I SAM-dependent methyltransferase [Pseudomonadota bacterium]
MTPAEYDAWYATPRGRWIGETEFRLLAAMTGLLPGESLLDVGCGTGWFTRRFAASNGWNVTGLDMDGASLAFARAHGRNERYLEGDARSLPFEDQSFDRVISVTALCFVDDWPQALGEMLRVARRKVVVGLLNRHSLLWLEKGRGRGTASYRGAHWHTRDEIRTALKDLPSTRPSLRSAVFLPGGSYLARAWELVLPNRLPWGGFLLLALEKLPS